MVFPKVITHESVLTSREPELHFRHFFGDDDESHQVIHSLQVSAIVPTKVRFALLTNASDDCSGPLIRRGVHRSESALHGALHIRKHIATLQRVALVAGRTGDLTQLGTHIAPLRADAERMARHLRGRRESASQHFELLPSAVVVQVQHRIVDLIGACRIREIGSSRVSLGCGIVENGERVGSHCVSF